MERFVNNKNALHNALKPHAKSKYTHSHVRMASQNWKTCVLHTVDVDLLEYTDRTKERKKKRHSPMYICFINKHRRYVTPCYNDTYTQYTIEARNAVRDECFASSNSSQLNGVLWLQFLGMQKLYAIRFNKHTLTRKRSYFAPSCPCMHIFVRHHECWRLSRLQKLCDGLTENNIQIILATPPNINHFHWHPSPYATI